MPDLGRRPGLALIGALLLFGLTSPATARQPAVEAGALAAQPGYVDLDQLVDFDPQAVQLEINLSGALLRLLSAAVEPGEDGLADLLSTLRSITVRIVDGERPEAEALRGDLTETVRSLQGGGWQSIVSVRDEGSLHLLVRADEESIQGLFATFTDEDGGVGLLNIVGDFDPVLIGSLARQLDLPLGDLGDLAVGASQR